MALPNLFSHLFSKKPEPVGSAFWQRHADMHSHIIPGVDDGPESYEESMRMIRVAYDAGVRTICATPHIREMWQTDSELLRDKFRELNRLKDQAGLTDMTLHLAAEYMLDDYFEKLLRKDDLLPLPGNLLLVETSFYEPAYNMEHLLFDLQRMGYMPLLAHPERYRFYQKDPSAYAAFKDKGYLFQLDLLSLLGAYGKNTQKTAQMLLSQGFIDFVGSDMHSPEHAERLKDFMQTPESAVLSTLR